MAGVTKHYWSSARLRYRAIDEDADTAMLVETLTDPITASLFGPPPVKPFSAKNVTKLAEAVQKDLLFAIICLPDEREPARCGKPIGFVNVRYGDNAEWSKLHRRSDLGITLAPEFQGKGFGPEALSWILEKAFQHYGMHRVSLVYWSYNPNAGKAYFKCGFVEEGRAREQWFSNGKWWDEIHMSILEHEWREKHQLA